MGVAARLSCGVRSHVKIARWFLVLPAGAAGFYAGVALAILLVALLQWLCPIEDQVSGLCFASWYRPAESAAIVLGAALGAVCTVSLPALAAPSHKRQISALFYAAGTAYAVWFLSKVGSSFLLPFVAAVVSGALAVVAWFRRAQSAT